MSWVPLLGSSIGVAVDGGLEGFTVSNTIDPLQKTLTMVFSYPLPGGSWNPLQVLVHGFAMANDCSVNKIKRDGKRTYVAHISTKRRLGAEINNNPFTMEKWKSTSQRKKEKFIQMMRDKAKELRRG